MVAGGWLSRGLLWVGLGAGLLGMAGRVWRLWFRLVFCLVEEVCR